MEGLCTKCGDLGLAGNPPTFVWAVAHQTDITNAARLRSVNPRFFRFHQPGVCVVCKGTAHLNHCGGCMSCTLFGWEEGRHWLVLARGTDDKAVRKAADEFCASTLPREGPPDRLVHHSLHSWNNEVLAFHWKPEPAPSE